MQTDIRILTKVGKGHHETKVAIDWTGVTEEQLRILATWALIHDLQARFVREDRVPPESIKIAAAEAVKMEPVLLMKFTPPPPKVRVDRKLEDLLRNLSPEELKVLLGETNGDTSG